MLEISPAKSLHGSVMLPPSPDLFALTMACALTSDKPVTVRPVSETPLIRRWIAAFEPVVSVRVENGGYVISPAVHAKTAVLSLPSNPVPLREFVVFLLLARGHSVSFVNISSRRCEVLAHIAAKARCVLEIVNHTASTELRLSAPLEIVIPAAGCSPEEIHAYFGLALGKGLCIAFETETGFLSPLRHILPLLGYPVTVKNVNPDKVTDPIAKRILKMKAKKRSDASPSFFTITADFSRRPANDVVIDLPGDEILGALLCAAKSLVQKGNLIIDNAPLELWNTQTLQLIRRMGGAVAVQETRQTSFGACGIIQPNRFTPVGKKVDCSPLFQFVNQLPAMVAISLFAEGQSVFRSLDDLRIDQPDGIEQMLTCLQAIGAHCGDMPDGIVLKGARHFDGFDLTQPLPAHIAGAFAMVGLHCIGKTVIAKEFLLGRWPDFPKILESICEYRN